MNSEAVLMLLREVAEKVVTPRFRRLAEGEVSEKSPGDLVTIADHEAEVLITERLAELAPQALILGEEAAAADPRLLQGLEQVPHWFTVDPIDGTKNFVHGSPDHAVMVGEVLDGQPVRGWIWQPEHGTAFVVERGVGAFVDGRRMEPVERPEHPRGVTSRESDVGSTLGPGLAPMALSWVCCGVDYPNLAAGAADYIVYGGTMPWDHVPGSLLLTELGGCVSHIDGSPYQPWRTTGGLIASATPQIADRVRPLVQAVLARHQPG